MATVKIKSKRLTNELKHTIKNRAVDWKFKEDQKKLDKLHSGLAEDIYSHFYSVELQEIIADLPEFMVNHSGNKLSVGNNSAIKDLCTCGGYDTDETWFNTIYFKFDNEETKLLIGSNMDKAALIKLKSSNKKLYNRMAKYVGAAMELSHRQTDFRYKLTSLMDQVGSTKKLVELLPDAESWITEVYGCNDLPAADEVAQLLDI